MISVSLLGELKRYRRVAWLLVGLLGLPLVAGAAIIFIGGIVQTRSYIADISARAVDDISYNNGAWNTARYDSDPEIPGNYRIYVITKDGFVIDRWRPIDGYLDTSNFRQLLHYRQPTTVHTITGQDWRLLSLPVDYHGTTLGVIAVGRLISVAEPGVLLVDQELQSSAKAMLQDLTVSNRSLDTHRVNVRSVPFTVSFQIVDQYNRILIKSDTANSIDRLPNYIDPSYIADNLEHASTKIVQSGDSSERYLSQSTPLRDASGSPIGTVIVARTISPYIDLTGSFIVISGLLAAVLFAASFYLTVRHLGPVTSTSDEAPALLGDEAIRSICFQKDKCVIIINDHEIPVSYATNQYYMCRALFGRPSKKWETDELVDQFGIEHGVEAWRKLYDAMSSVNKKCRAVIASNLIIASNKTYRINPELLPVISKTTSGK